MKAGFHKTGISPVDKSQVLSHLPHSTVSGDGNGTAATTELVSQSFIEHLNAARHGSDDKGVERTRRRKVSCAPGESIAAEDIAGPSQVPPKKPRKNSKNQKTVEVSDNATPPDCEPETPEVAIPSDVESSVGDSDIEPDSDISSTGPVARSTTNDMPNEGDFVIVTYEGDYYPGEVKSLKKNGAQVSCMMKSGQYWKWPSKPDLLLYPSLT